jgi:iron-sulfur cluster repair protein YtfE (RIC family)
LAAQAKYFDGDFDYKKHAIANTGRKTLTYADMVRHFQTTYNWSENPAIDQLTRYFQGVSSTIQHGRKLEFLHHYDKLGLEAYLKGMEEEAQSHYLAELTIIAPVLESIAGDSSVMNIARQRARRLLERSRAEAAGAVKVAQ